MADTIETKWVYPPNWDGNLPPQGGWKKVHFIRTCRSDGTGETNAVALNIGELRTTEGEEVKRTAIEYIKWHTRGFDQIILEWDRTPDEHIMTLSGDKSGTEDFRSFGGLVDPGEADEGTGDILVSTVGADNYDNYTIEMIVRLKT